MTTKSAFTLEKTTDLPLTGKLKAASRNVVRMTIGCTALIILIPCYVTVAVMFLPIELLESLLPDEGA
jgi:hypothetical protein